MTGSLSLLEKMVEYCEGSQCEKAIEILEKAAALDPKDPEIHYQMGICYSGGCRTHSLVQSDIALEHFRLALRSGEVPLTPANRGKILCALGNAYLHSSLLSQNRRILAAIECHEKAASIYIEQRNAELWAMEQYNLGNAWCEMPEEGCPEKWREAIARYRAALPVRTRERDPEGHAATLQNLGTAYRELKDGNRANNVKTAIRCYCLALRVCSRSSHPAQYASIQNNLGNAYLSLPASQLDENRRNILRGIRHYDRALMIRNSVERPCDYAITQFNKGNALFQLAILDGEDTNELTESARCYRESEIFSQWCSREDLAREAKKRLGKIQTLVHSH